jgi:hypothetical protein
VTNDDNPQNDINGHKKSVFSPCYADVSRQAGKTDPCNPWTYRHRSRKLHYVPFMPAQMPDRGNLRGSKREDMADRPDALCDLQFLRGCLSD